MTVEEAVRTRVAAIAAVTALAGARVYLDVLPQSPVYPAVRVQLVDDIDGYHLRGPVGTKTARVQVDAYAREASGADPYAQAKSLAAVIAGDGAVSSATGLSGWKGAIGSPPFTVAGCFRVARTRRYDPAELRVVTMSQDFVVWYRE